MKFDTVTILCNQYRHLAVNFYSDSGVNVKQLQCFNDDNNNNKNLVSRGHSFDMSIFYEGLK